MAKVNPAEFIRQVRHEVSKVTWPTRKEVIVSTIMVMVMVTITALFFLLVDSVLSYGIRFLLNLEI